VSGWNLLQLFSCGFRVGVGSENCDFPVHTDHNGRCSAELRGPAIIQILEVLQVEVA
jgi:hypothetical protein